MIGFFKKKEKNKPTGVINWWKIVPPIGLALQLQSKPDHLLARLEIIKLIQCVRSLVCGENLLVIEEEFSDDSDGPQIVLHSRERVSWDIVISSFETWQFSQWQLTGKESDVSFWEEDTKVYFVIEVNDPCIEVIIPRDLDIDNSLKSLISENQMQVIEQNPALIEWKYLTHYDQEVGYGGDWTQYLARGKIE